MSDFFDSDLGCVKWGSNRLALLQDAYMDVVSRLGRHMVQIRQAARRTPPGRILMVGVEVPGRNQDIHDVMARLVASTRHIVETSVVPMGNRGKFDNIDDAVRSAPSPLDTYDWLVVTDDDVAFSPTFLDDLIALASAADLSVSQPAHAWNSHTTYELTRRVAGSLARVTRFVEIGPLTLFRADAFAAFVPFVTSRWCFGIDAVWSQIATNHALKLGIIDGAPLRHLRPVGGSYDVSAAILEGKALLAAHHVNIDRKVMMETEAVVLRTNASALSMGHHNSQSFPT